MAFQGDSIYWVEVEKVVPNPFQPRREFDDNKLQELSESIRMYGVLQPLTVTRREVQNPDNGTFFTEYELIAGERRLRASRLAGIAQVPVIIREGEQSEQEKLELAIIENLQREDLNAVDRALAFQQLAEQFNLNHAEVGRKVGRSREYVANSIRLLQLPEHMRAALQKGELGEGHARTLLMLNDRPEEQETVFREVLLKKMSVRELERIARKIATDKVRKPNKGDIDSHLIEIEKEFTETLGTRVQIQKTEFGGKLTIDYFSEEDLSALLDRVRAEQAQARQVTSSVAESLSDTTPMTVTHAAAAPVPQTATVPAYVPETNVFNAPRVAQQPSAVPESEVVTESRDPESEVRAVQYPTGVRESTITQPLSSAHVEVDKPNDVPAPSQSTTSPDPSLLARLASFTRPTPIHTSAAQPYPTAQQEPQMVSENNDTVPEKVDELSASTTTPPATDIPQAGPSYHRNMTALKEETPQENAALDDPDEDLYSMRNFTV